MTTPHTNHYTALVRTKDSSCTLAETLSRLKSQIAPPAEIIVVDSGSTDATLRIAADSGCRIIHYPAGQPFSYSKALNIGFDAATTPLVLVNSSHVWLGAADTTHWMRYLLNQLPVAAVFCPWGPTRTRMEDSLVPRFWTIDKENFTGLNGLSNCCAMYRKSDWQQRAFDEGIATAEDQLWASQSFAEGGMTLCLSSHGIDYRNPHGGLSKAIHERSVVSLYVLPTSSLSRRWHWHLLVALKKLMRGRLRDAAIHLAVAKNCFRHTVMNMSYSTASSAASRGA